MFHYITCLVIFSYLTKDCISSSLFYKDMDQIQSAGILKKLSKSGFQDSIEGLKSSSPKTTSHGNLPTGKRWQVGRISRKEYEIIQMLWTSTKPYNYNKTLDDSKFPFTTHNKSLILRPGTLINAQNTNSVRKFPMTPSYIEFYYLNDNDIIQSDTKIRFPIRNSSQLKSGSEPVFSFRVNDVPFKRFAHRSPETRNNVLCENVKLCAKVATVKATKARTSTKRTYYFTTVPGLRFATKIVHIKASNIKKSPATRDTMSSVTHTTKNNNNHKFFAASNRKNSQNNRKPQNNNKSQNNKNTPKTSTIHTTVNDAMLFFKQHDTPIIKSNILNTTRKVFSEKKIKNSSESQFTPINTSSQTYIPKDHRFLQNGTFLDNKSKAVSWKEYPFVAAYIHEPSDIHCDAASLSQHWLVAAASCLSRRKKDSEGQSPFVTYCGDSWRYPKRITYVKYSVVHPRYHSNDHSRRYFYNIGLIQVVAALSTTCPGWTPVSLVSHQFIIDQDGTSASALGWGMDRYSDTTEDLPIWPLMLYNSIIYSTICPGSYGFRRVKESNEEKSIKNIYCLALPPYAGEKSDPVHGGLLLAEGKLIALYLKEERRSWGEQSAEYTGLWQHIPWIQETAREPDSTEIFSV